MRLSDPDFEKLIVIEGLCVSIVRLPHVGVDNVAVMRGMRVILMLKIEQGFSCLAVDVRSNLIFADRQSRFGGGAVNGEAMMPRSAGPISSKISVDEINSLTRSHECSRGWV